VASRQQKKIFLKLTHKYNLSINVLSFFSITIFQIENKSEKKEEEKLKLSQCEHNHFQPNFEHMLDSKNKSHISERKKSMRIF
jgi:hypothetical protein